MRRRALLSALLAAPAAGMAPGARAAGIDYPLVVPRPLVFPRDFGAHPEFRVEWWYLTGWLDAAAGGAPLGFQITFFRVRPDITEGRSALSANRLLIAHAAIADPAAGQLLADEAIARATPGAVFASQADTDLRLDRWTFTREAASGIYRGNIPARGFALQFSARPTQPLLLQGKAGWSQKGPFEAQASYYYSEPQLEVEMVLTRSGTRETRRGRAWLDHEWSSTLLDARAAGWDWIGMNLADGSALTAFQMRAREAAPDAPPLWAYASLRAAGGTPRIYSPQEVSFRTLETWTSPRTRTRWPVAQAIRVGECEFRTRPLMQDQELDSRRSTGAIYWEGASTLLEAGAEVGRGYLEMTGYREAMRLG